MSDLDDQEQESSTQSTGRQLAVSKSMAITLDRYFTKLLRNQEWLQIRGACGLPKVASTKTFQMEAFLKEVTPSTKGTNKLIVKIHSCLLDAVALLTAIMDKKVMGSDCNLLPTHWGRNGGKGGFHPPPTLKRGGSAERGICQGFEG